MRVEQCCCGGQIAVMADARDEAIAEAVRTHNRTRRHDLWRRRPPTVWIHEHGYRLEVAA